MNLLKKFFGYVRPALILLLISLVVLMLGLAAVIIQRPDSSVTYCLGLFSGVILTLVWVIYEDDKDTDL